MVENFFSLGFTEITTFILKHHIVCTNEVDGTITT